MAFQLINEYPAYPLSDGTCFTCRASRRPNERVVDLGRTYDHVEDLDGNVHSMKAAAICESCVLELAHMFGCASQARTEQLVTDLNAAQHEVGVLRNKLDAVQPLIDLANGVTIP